MGRLQFWLQRREWWPACWLGNRISDVRYWLWRARGGKWPTTSSDQTITIDVRYSNAASNTGKRLEDTDTEWDDDPPVNTDDLAHPEGATARWDT